MSQTSQTSKQKISLKIAFCNRCKHSKTLTMDNFGTKANGSFYATCIECRKKHKSTCRCPYCIGSVTEGIHFHFPASSLQNGGINASMPNEFIDNISVAPPSEMFQNLKQPLDTQANPIVNQQSNSIEKQENNPIVNQQSNSIEKQESNSIEKQERNPIENQESKSTKNQESNSTKNQERISAKNQESISAKNQESISAKNQESNSKQSQNAFQQSTIPMEKQNDVTQNNSKQSQIAFQQSNITLENQSNATTSSTSTTLTIDQISSLPDGFWTLKKNNNLKLINLVDDDQSIVFDSPATPSPKPRKATWKGDVDMISNDEIDSYLCGYEAGIKRE